MGPKFLRLSLQLSLAGSLPAAMVGAADQHAGSGPQLDAGEPTADPWRALKIAYEKLWDVH